MTPKRAAVLAQRHAINRASIDAARARQAVSGPTSWWTENQEPEKRHIWMGTATARSAEVNAAFAAQHTPRRDEP